MLRNNKTSTSMQKTYDECYLICSTAVYFEGQNNEEEALRSWRSALDRIYYHNAYKVAPNYQAASATEKALQDSLREMELQCKERVSLLEALKKSREEAADKSEDGKLRKTDPKASRPLPKIPSDSSVQQQSSQQQPPPQQQGSFPGWIGGGTVPSVSYEDIPGPNQAAVKKPSASKSRSNEQSSSRPKLPSSSRAASSTSQLTPRSGSGDARESSRTPSPEKKTSMLRTTLRADRNGKKPGKPRDTLRSKPPSAGIKAAGLAWDTKKTPVSRPDSASGNYPSSSENTRRSSADVPPRSSRPARPLSPPAAPTVAEHRKTQKYVNGSASEPQQPPRPPKHGLAAQQILQQHKANSSSSRATPSSPQPAVSYTKPPPDFLKYRSEYPATEPISQAAISASVNPPKFARPVVDDEPKEGNEEELPVRPKKAPPPPPLSRRPVSRPAVHPSSTKPGQGALNSTPPKPPAVRKKKATPPASKITTPPSSDESEEAPEPSLESSDWRERLAYVKKHLPKGVDEGAAKSIFNEIVVEGDEVHWDDVAGLDAAKTALKEAVVYPFLRPDLFMGLREPARGMLLFGPPGTGKTMLARAVATESRSTFFAISASSLTSKWMGESEKLVRALFQLAKALAPSIIFVDEIDSLLSSRGDGEHETTRRIKTEFLIQWSDLQRAAAGKEAKASGEGDATRVLVLAATNLPWAIDEAARRRFVRRQYIPLPEAHVREQQLKTLLGHQKQTLSKNDIKVLVEVTDGYSGSDITALAKDAAMGPLRSLGESLLHMSPDEIRPIAFDDFEASLINIRPSVSKQGLKEFEDWAREFGERAG